VIGLAMAFILVPVLGWIVFAIMAKRWHDRGRTGAWSLLMLPPIIVSNHLFSRISRGDAPPPEDANLWRVAILVTTIGALWAAVELGLLPGRF
jgi:uncharacterized membrane protein YhaH (DUF805 family)